MDDRDLNEGIEVFLDAIEKQRCDPSELFGAMLPVCRGIGLGSAAVYLDDEYPDRMRRVFCYGDHPWFPEHVVRSGDASLLETLRGQLTEVPNLLSARLKSRVQEIGVLAAVPGSRGVSQAKFDVLCGLLSIMAHIASVHGYYNREREERDIFFAQSLTSRLLIPAPPQVEGLRSDFQHVRSLEAGGDFYDLVPTRDGGLLGMIGCCSGTGLRTVLAIASVMREASRASRSCPALSDILLRINDLLIRERNRAHQASLCVFEVDVAGRQLRLAKAGRLGILLGGKGTGMQNISASGGLFLGLLREPRIQNETFPFRPGQSLLCVTEGFYSSRGDTPVRPQLRQLLQAAENAMENRADGVSLAKAVVDNLDQAAEYNPKSMLVLSVDFLGGAADERQAARKRAARRGDAVLSAVLEPGL